MSQELKTAKDAAAKAGKILLDYFNSGSAGKIENKSETDRVSNADKDSEKTIRKTISAQFPDHHIIGEEFGESGGKSDYVWYFDPLCGSMNFIHGLSEFGISIALTHKEKLVLGVCFMPVTSELFWAEKGKGAFFNGKKIHVSKTFDMFDAIVTTDFASNIRPRVEQLKIVNKIAMSAQYLRITGSYPNTVCKLAQGKTDAHVEFNVPPIHRLAATIVVLEAGGRMTRSNGEEASIFDGDVILSNGIIHNKIVDVLSL